ncbi:hypothetical protein MKQ70_06170 [Chitinophaga sedimenti]|uniref:hypothetical protein n=1 Tax=Chitinophaga sedimenti TaxID=2033606 RepID=UPI002005D14F|nr:hypothetical protein [Chitinophaga sedimenti]MCK7554611.1 hypothetical protein [Chitinophaga sedimenti]
MMVPFGWRYLLTPERGNFETWKPLSDQQPENGLETAQLITVAFPSTIPKLTALVLKSHVEDRKAVLHDSATVQMGGREAFVMFMTYTDPSDSSNWQSTVVLRTHGNRSFVFEGEAPNENAYRYSFSIFKHMGLSLLIDEEMLLTK